jgi:hypothetical protein
MTTELAVPGEEIADAEIVGEHAPAVVFQGVIALEWPAPRPASQVEPLPGWGISVFDAISGRQIMTVTKVEVRAPVSGVITADLTMFTDEDGKPVYELEPGASKGSLKIPALEGGKPREGTFPFYVSQMRVRQ